MKKLKKILNEETQNIVTLDFIILFILTIIYGILSFHKLGSTTNPNSFQDFLENESIVIELEKEENIIKMKSFNGYKNSNYQIYVSNNNKDYNYLTTITGKGSFAWDNIRLTSKGKYIKIIFDQDSNLGELAFYNNNQEQIKIKQVSYNNKKIKTLTDEKEIIPKTVSYYNSTYFDEIYFARTAYEYTKNIATYEWTHPPLGKLIQAIPIYITGKMTPFNYRLMGNIFGIMMIPLIYIFAKKMFKKRKYAIFASLLLLLDTFHFTQTRIGTIDSYLVFFIILSLYFMYQFTATTKTKYLFLSGFCFSLSISVKWTGFYAGIALAIIFFTHLIKNKNLNFKYLLQGCFFFVLIPVTLYTSIYLLFPNNSINYTNNLESIIKQQKDMYEYHSNVEDGHFFASKWYTWPIVYKPIWYHEQTLSNNNKETITAIGNITIWWVGIISSIYLLVKLIVKKDKNSFFLLIIMLSLWLPYSFIKREMFIYHFFPVTPFLILSITLMFKDLVSKLKNSIILPLYLICVLTFFVLYYPVISGKSTNNNYIEGLRIFDTWYF